MTQLELQDVSKIYPGAALPAIDGLSLSVEEGALTALLGPSASGKSTILKMIAGLIDPTSGDIRLRGRSILSLPPDKRDIVLVFQEHLLFPHLNVADNIGFGLRMRRQSRAEIARAVDEMMDLLRLGGLAARKPAALSGGQQQRVALARALVLRPKLLLLDEPFANLDAPLRIEMQSLLKSLQQSTGTTMLFVTHDQSEAVRLCNSIALLIDGRLRQHGQPADFYARPNDRVVAEFFGARNFLAGHVTEGHFDCALGRLQLPMDAPPEGRILTIRPENILINTPSAAGTSGRATIDDIVFLGEKVMLRLRSGGVSFEAYVSPFSAPALTVGSEVAVHFPPEALWVLP